ncbi:MAG TPA: 16S rRNA (cytosine(967)-C(5))-methyltransferase RsmB [Ignavibacteria bacterium]|nr:16S rRNA (cytosine(967)-C(5))-methyltransferase RsmB [Ignavibacteria bacterium]
MENKETNIPEKNETQADNKEIKNSVEPQSDKPQAKEAQKENHKHENQEKNQNHRYKPDFNDKTIFCDARSIAVKILCRTERTDSYLDKLIDAELRTDVLNDFDKSLLNELSHGVIRWMRRLDWFLNGFYRGNYEKCLPEVKNTLRVAMYQILFLNKIPHFAAVNEAVEFIKKLRGDKHAAVVNGLLRTILRTLNNLVWPSRDVDEVNYLGIVQSHPNWMVKRWIARFGFDDAVKLCESNNKRPILSLRINKLKISSEDFEKYLNEKNIQFRKSDYLSNFYTIKILSKIYADDYFKQGYFSVQDISAGFVAELIKPQEGDLIIDLCSAPGGKTAHLSELMSNKGEIIAVEKYLSRIEVMKSNFKRLEVKNVKILHDDVNEPTSAELTETLVGKADKVLLDAPCSGLGVLSKKPDIKWKREFEDIKMLQDLQMNMIENASKYVKPGGVLVYSTCTTEKEENMDVVNQFLQNHPEFEIDAASKYVTDKVVNSDGVIEVFPHTHHIDGSFAARLVRKS